MAAKELFPHIFMLYNMASCILLIHSCVVAWVWLSTMDLKSLAVKGCWRSLTVLWVKNSSVLYVRIITNSELPLIRTHQLWPPRGVLTRIFKRRIRGSPHFPLSVMPASITNHYCRTLTNWCRINCASTKSMKKLNWLDKVLTATS